MIKRLAIFIYLLISLVNSITQILINEDNLPVLIKNDTVIVQDEVWIESVDSEIKQRGDILHLNRKLERLHNIMHKKKGYEGEIDSLGLINDSLLIVTDSLNTELLFALEVESGKIVDKLVGVTAMLKSTRTQYFVVRDKLKKSRNRKLGLIGILIIESCLLILLI